MSPEWLSAQQIRDQARKAFPEPTYPPPPAGRPVVHQTTRKVCTQIPQFRGFQIAMQNVCTDVPDQISTVEGPSTNETKEWQAKVASMRADYEMAVDQQAARISERQRSDLKSYVRDMIQISTGILGLIVSIATFVIGAMRGNIPKLKEDKETFGEGERKPETT